MRAVDDRRDIDRNDDRVGNGRVATDDENLADPGGFLEAARLRHRLQHGQRSERLDHTWARDLAADEHFLRVERTHDDGQLGPAELLFIGLAKTLPQGRRRQACGLYLVGQRQRDAAVGTHEDGAVEFRIVIETNVQLVAGLQTILSGHRACRKRVRLFDGRRLDNRRSACAEHHRNDQ